MYSELPIYGAQCDLDWQKLVFTRCLARKSIVGAVRVSAKITSDAREEAQPSKGCERALFSIKL
jgi:hypothetical protein